MNNAYQVFGLKDGALLEEVTKRRNFAMLILFWQLLKREEEIEQNRKTFNDINNAYDIISQEVETSLPEKLPQKASPSTELIRISLEDVYKGFVKNGVKFTDRVMLLLKIK
jgi:hypothetical protein